MMLWIDRRLDGMTRRPDGWQGTKFSDLQTVQNLLEALLNSGIPVKMHLYKEVILSNRMANLQTNISLRAPPQARLHGLIKSHNKHLVVHLGVLIFKLEFILICCANIGV
jgi:hypothetical protein